MDLDPLSHPRGGRQPNASDEEDKYNALFTLPGMPQTGSSAQPVQKLSVTFNRIRVNGGERHRMQPSVENDVRLGAFRAHGGCHVSQEVGQASQREGRALQREDHALQRGGRRSQGGQYMGYDMRDGKHLHDDVEEDREDHQRKTAMEEEPEEKVKPDSVSTRFRPIPRHHMVSTTTTEHHDNASIATQQSQYTRASSDLNSSPNPNLRNPPSQRRDHRHPTQYPVYNLPPGYTHGRGQQARTQVVGFQQRYVDRQNFPGVGNYYRGQEGYPNHQYHPYQPTGSHHREEGAFFDPRGMVENVGGFPRRDAGPHVEFDFVECKGSKGNMKHGLVVRKPSLNQHIIQLRNWGEIHCLYGCNKTIRLVKYAEGINGAMYNFMHHTCEAKKQFLNTLRFRIKDMLNAGYRPFWKEGINIYALCPGCFNSPQMVGRMGKCFAANNLTKHIYGGVSCRNCPLPIPDFHKETFKKIMKEYIDNFYVKPILQVLENPDKIETAIYENFLEKKQIKRKQRRAQNQARVNRREDATPIHDLSEEGVVIQVDIEGNFNQRMDINDTFKCILTITDKMKQVLSDRRFGRPHVELPKFTVTGVHTQSLFVLEGRRFEVMVKYPISYTKESAFALFNFTARRLSNYLDFEHEVTGVLKGSVVIIIRVKPDDPVAMINMIEKETFRKSLEYKTLVPTIEWRRLNSADVPKVSAFRGFVEFKGRRFAENFRDEISPYLEIRLDNEFVAVIKEDMGQETKTHSTLDEEKAVVADEKKVGEGKPTAFRAQSADAIARSEDKKHFTKSRALRLVRAPKKAILRRHRSLGERRRSSVASLVDIPHWPGTFYAMAANGEFDFLGKLRVASYLNPDLVWRCLVYSPNTQRSSLLHAAASSMGTKSMGLKDWKKYRTVLQSLLILANHVKPFGAMTLLARQDYLSHTPLTVGLQGSKFTDAETRMIRALRKDVFQQFQVHKNSVNFWRSEFMDRTTVPRKEFVFRLLETCRIDHNQNWDFTIVEKAFDYLFDASVEISTDLRPKLGRPYMGDMVTLLLPPPSMNSYSFRSRGEKLFNLRKRSFSQPDESEEEEREEGGDSTRQYELNITVFSLADKKKEPLGDYTRDENEWILKAERSIHGSIVYFDAKDYVVGLQLMTTGDDLNENLSPVFGQQGKSHVVLMAPFGMRIQRFDAHFDAAGQPIAIVAHCMSIQSHRLHFSKTPTAVPRCVDLNIEPLRAEIFRSLGGGDLKQSILRSHLKTKTLECMEKDKENFYRVVHISQEAPVTTRQSPSEYKSSESKTPSKEPKKGRALEPTPLLSARGKRPKSGFAARILHRSQACIFRLYEGPPGKSRIECYLKSEETKVDLVVEFTAISKITKSEKFATNFMLEVVYEVDAKNGKMETKTLSFCLEDITTAQEWYRQLTNVLSMSRTSSEDSYMDRNRAREAVEARTHRRSLRDVRTKRIGEVLYSCEDASPDLEILLSTSNAQQRLGKHFRSVKSVPLYLNMITTKSELLEVKSSLTAGQMDYIREFRTPLQTEKTIFGKELDEDHYILYEDVKSAPKDRSLYILKSININLQAVNLSPIVRKEDEPLGYQGIEGRPKQVSFWFLRTDKWGRFSCSRPLEIHRYDYDFHQVQNSFTPMISASMFVFLERAYGPLPKLLERLVGSVLSLDSKVLPFYASFQDIRQEHKRFEKKTILEALANAQMEKKGFAVLDHELSMTSRFALMSYRRGFASHGPLPPKTGGIPKDGTLGWAVSPFAWSGQIFDAYVLATKSTLASNPYHLILPNG
mmetsp:Transcript_24561/g.38700  ORF Transcript_24561/g.38700 Transcript_24561/m.38700 type:complete len:1772 (-) Transcript_24561:1223-6538(-)